MIGKWFCAILALILLTSSLASAASQASTLVPEDQGYPRTITDSAGRTVTVEMPVNRIIVLNSDAAEAVEVLGAGSKIVGVTDVIVRDSERFPNLGDRELIGSWKEFDYEKIASLAMNGSDSIVPDIIVIGYVYPDRPQGVFAVEESLSSFENITPIGLDFFRQETLLDEIEKLGVVLGRKAEAEAVSHWIGNKEDGVKAFVEGRDRPRVYIESSSVQGLGSLSSYGNGSASNDLCRIAGGNNIGGDFAEYPKVEWEWVVSENPDVIIKIKSTSSLGWSDIVDLRAEVDEIMARPGADEVSAVKSGRVYVCYWPMHFGLNSVVGLTYWAKIFHPDIELDPALVHEEYMSLLGQDYPKGRLFVYPDI